MAGPNDIGDVYLQVHADTKGLRREIKLAAELAGREFGGDFTDSLGSELDAGMTQTGRDIREKLAREGSLSGRDFSSSMEQAIQSRLKRFDIDLRDSIVFGNWDNVLKQFDDLDQGVEHVVKRMSDLHDIGEMDRVTFDQANASLNTYVAKEQDLTDALHRSETAHKRQGKAFNDEMTAIRDLRKAMESGGSISNLFDEESRALKRVEDDLKIHARLTKKAGTEADTASGGLNKFNKALDSLQGKINKAHPRNDFVNLLVRLGGLITSSFIGTIKRFAEAMVDVGSGFKSLKGGGGGLSGIVKGIQGLSAASLSAAEGFVGLGAGLVVVVSGLGAIASAIPALYSGLVSLTGAVVGLAGEVAVGLSGALLALGPLLGAVATGLFVVVSGFTTLSNNVKHTPKVLKEAVHALDDLSKAWKRIKIDFTAKLFAGLPAEIGNIKDLLNNSISPLLNDMATAAAGVGTAFVNSMDSPQMKAVFKVFDQTWPTIFQNLGDAAARAFEGILEVIAVISPDMELFSQRISDAAANFRAWAGSAKGKNQIKDFFDKAWAAADDLWGIIKNVATALGGLFAIATSDQQTKQGTFLGGIRDETEKLSNWINDPKNKGKINEWFTGAKTTVHNIWTEVKNVGKKLNEWNTEKNRKEFDRIVTDVGDILDKTIWIITKLDAWHQKISSVGDAFEGLVSGSTWERIFPNAPKWLTEPGAFFTAIKNTWNKIKWGQIGTDIMNGIVQGMVIAPLDGLAWVGDKIIKGIKHVLGIKSPATTMIPVGLDLIAGIIQGMLQALASAPGKVLDAFMGFITPIVNQVKTKVSSMMTGVGTSISSGFNKAKGKVQAAMTSIGGKISDGFTKARDKVGSAMTTISNRIGSGWNTAKNKVQSAMTKIGAKISDTWDRARTVTQQKASAIVSAVQNHFGKAKDKVASAMRAIGTKIGNSWDAARNKTVKVGGAIVTSVQNKFSQAVTAVHNKMEAIKNRVSSGFSSAVNNTKTWMAKLGTAVSNGITHVLSFFRNLGTRIRNAAGNVGSTLVQVGRDVINGLKNGMQSAWRGALTWVANAVAGLSKTAKKVLGISSPSKVFMKIGEDTVRGFVIGFSNGAEKGSGAFQKVTEKAMRSLTAGLYKGADQAGTAVRNILSKVNTLAGNAIRHNNQALANTIKTIRSSHGLSAKEKASTIADLKKANAELNRSVTDSQAILIASIKKKGAALLSVLTSLKNAKQKLADLQAAFRDLRDQTAEGIKGQLDLGGLVGQGGPPPTFAGIAGYVAGMKAKAQKFSNRMKKLVKAGLPPAFIQEITGLGLDGAIQVADALLKGSPKEIKKLSADFAAFNAAATGIGTTLAKSMYQAGIDAQKGLIKGLTKDKKGLDQAAKKLADLLTAYVKKHLGIKSPSTVFQNVGQQVMAGMTRGIQQGTGPMLKAAGQAALQLSRTGAGATIGAPSLRRPVGGGGWAGPGVAPAGRSLTIASGAIVVQAPQSDPRLVASKVLDRLVHVSV